MPGDRRRSPPWWPIHVDADVEPDGLRVTGSQAAPVLAPGSLVRWEAIASPEQPRCRDELGEIRKVGRRPIMLRVAGRGGPKNIKRPAVSWFSNPDHRFRIAIRPGGRRRATIQALTALVLVLIPTGIPLVMAGGLVPFSDDAGEIGRRADIATNGFLLLCATGAVLGILIIAREWWSIRRAWWVEELNERSIRVRRGDMTSESAWGELRGFRERLVSLEILPANGHPIRVERVCPTRWAVQGRLPLHAPLWSVFFIASLLIAIVGPIGSVWLLRWLQFPPDAFGWPQYLFMQVMLLIPPGAMLATHWWVNRRAAAPETPDTDPE